MGRANFLIGNFNSGELTPRVRIRTDLQRYFSACQRNVNFHILTQGGVAKRMGSIVNNLAISANKKSLLVSFSKSAWDNLILEFSHLKMRVWQEDYTQAMNGASVYELTTPWGEDDLEFLSFTQQVDIIYVSRTDCSLPQKILRRFANNSWDIVDLDFKDGPWLALNDPPVSITPSGVSGSININAASGIFSANSVGSLMRILENTGSPPVLKWESAKSVTSGDKRLNGGRVYQAAATGTTGNNPPIHTEGSVSDGAINWQFVHDGAGVVKITGYTSPTLVSAQVLSTLPSTNPTTYWQFGAFSSISGYGATSAIHQERLFIGQTAAEPDTIFGTSSSGYSSSGGDFKPGLGTGLVVDSDAIRRSLSGNEVRPILHLISAGALYAFTPKSIEVITGPSDKEPITPAGMAAISRPGIGAHWKVAPVRGSEEIIYVSNSGRKILAMPWANDAAEGKVRDISILAEHIGRLGKFRALALCEDPEPTLWVLNEYGQLFGVAYDPGQDVIGWWRVEFSDNAIVESIATMSKTDGANELWLCVVRNIDGVTRRSIEHLPRFLNPREPRDLACHLDGAYYWDTWNKDTTKMVQINHVGAISRDETFYVNMSNNLFNSSHIGSELWIAYYKIVDDRQIKYGPIKVEILAINSSVQFSAKAITDIPVDFVNVFFSDWALTIETLYDLDLWQDTKGHVFADGLDKGEFNVDILGSVDLGFKTARGFIGHKFEAKLQLLPIDVGGDIGSNLGGKIRCDRLAVLVQDALQYNIGEVGGDKIIVNVRDPKDAMSAAPSLNDKLSVVPFAGNWAGQTSIEISSNDPFSCEIAGLSARVISND